MKVLLAIDDSQCSEAALDAVLEQFQPKETDVCVLNVDEWPRGLPISAEFAEGPDAANSIMETHEEMRRRAQELISRAACRLMAANFRAHTEMRQGDARHEILDYAANWNPDLIVLGSHGRKGWERFLLGSVSESVVRHATCSVEVIR